MADIPRSQGCARHLTVPDCIVIALKDSRSDGAGTTELLRSVGIERPDLWHIDKSPPKLRRKALIGILAAFGAFGAVIIANCWLGVYSWG